MLMDKIFALCWIVLAAARFTAGQGPVVNLPDGEVHGNYLSVNVSHKTYSIHEFAGIPYAQPPLGEWRFRKPQKMGPLGVFYAQQYGPSCIQLISGILPDQYQSQSEDCLTLNVYVPEQQPDSLAGHAVLVWIHGGGLVEGSSESYNPTYLAALGNIIIVTFNYRLNVFGFLSTGDDVAPGNYGLWDQRLVLEWVQENIVYFGGDKYRVTIGGESAGGASCILQANPNSYGLFQSMILQSAASLTPYKLERNEKSLDEVIKLATSVQCDVAMATNEQVVDCLRIKTATELLNAIKENKLQYSPIIDGDLVTFDPSSLLLQPETDKMWNERMFFQSLRILSGFNSHDGAKTWLLQFGRNEMENFKPSNEDVDYYIQQFSAKYQLLEYKEELRALIKAEYTNWTAPMDYKTIRLQLTKLAGDMLYGVPAMGFAHAHRANSAAARHFLYHFRASPTYHFLPTQSWIYGANHADELRFVFGIDKFFPGEDEDTNWEIALSHNMMTYWASFVKSGDPNPITASTLPMWPAYDTESQFYIALDQNSSDLPVGQYLYAREVNFWLNVFPELVKAVHEPDYVSCPEYDGASLQSCFMPLIFLSVLIFLLL